MKKLTRERAVPTISARVCWLTFSTTDPDSLPERAGSKRTRALDKKLMQGQSSSRLGCTVVALTKLVMFAAGDCVDCDLAAVEPHAPGLAKLIVRNCAVWTGRALLSRIMLHLSWG